MFRSTARNLHSWWTEFSEDILGADLAEETAEEPLAAGPLGTQLLRELRDGATLSGARRDSAGPAPQAHLRRVTLARSRRAGAVPAPAEVCLAPVSWTPPVAPAPAVACRRPTRA